MTTLAVLGTGTMGAPIAGNLLGAGYAVRVWNRTPAKAEVLVAHGAGAGPVRARVEPIFDVLGRQTLWLEHIGDGSRLKLALNNWLAVLVEGMAETLTLTATLGLDPHLFVRTIAGGPLASPYAVAKGDAMLEANFQPGFPLRHATKDAMLAQDAAQHSGLILPLTAALLRRWQDAIALGHGDDDVASAVTASAATATPAARL
jgi:3-hydroxyisobutyrate dehydrogenase